MLKPKNEKPVTIPQLFFNIGRKEVAMLFFLLIKLQYIQNTHNELSQFMSVFVCYMTEEINYQRHTSFNRLTSDFLNNNTPTTEEKKRVMDMLKECFNCLQKMISDFEKFEVVKKEHR